MSILDTCANGAGFFHIIFIFSNHSFLEALFAGTIVETAFLPFIVDQQHWITH